MQWILHSGSLKQKQRSAITNTEIGAIHFVSSRYVKWMDVMQRPCGQLTSPHNAWAHSEPTQRQCLVCGPAFLSILIRLQPSWKTCSPLQTGLHHFPRLLPTPSHDSKHVLSEWEMSGQPGNSSVILFTLFARHGESRQLLLNYSGETLSSQTLQPRRADDKCDNEWGLAAISLQHAPSSLPSCYGVASACHI